jgi:hypothetical protein
MTTPLKAQTAAQILKCLADGRMSARQIAFVTGQSYWGIASCLRGMQARGEIAGTVARPGKEPVYWLKLEAKQQNRQGVMTCQQHS